MSVPFSNTHLRVPRGFDTILEGLTREVLRDQPDNIPKYAAQYFEALLKQRQDSGVDPVDWATRLEDKVYNNDAFEATEALDQSTATPEKETAAEETIPKAKSYESQSEDESSHSEEISHNSTTQPNASEEVDLIENRTQEEEKLDTTDEHILTEKRLSEEESVNELPDADIQPDELRDKEEERHQTPAAFSQVGKTANGKDSSSVPDHYMIQSKLEPADLLSFRSLDVCDQESRAAEDEAGEKGENAFKEKDIMASDAEDKAESWTMEGANAEDNTHVAVEDGKRQPEENVLLPSLSESKTSEYNQQEDQTETTTERQETQNSSEGIHESLAHIEAGVNSDVTPKDVSLFELNFEAVPGAQQMKEFGERQPEEKDSVEVLQSNIMEMQPKEESNDVATAASDQNISATQDHDEYEMMGVEKDVNSEAEEVERQHEVFITKDKVDTNDSNLNDEDEETGEGVNTISSSNQPISKADEENTEYKIDQKNGDTRKISEGQNEPDFKEAEATEKGDKGVLDKEVYSEVEDREINEGSAENQSPQIAQANSSPSATEAECETLEAQYLAEEDEKSLGTPVESKPEDTGEEKEVISKQRTSEAERPMKEGQVDSEIQKSYAVLDEGRISPCQSPDPPPTADHQGEESPPGAEKERTEPEGNSGDKKEDCSRPQEEEDIMDIPLDDPEANRAAAKIQAGFRGHMTRKKMKPEDKAEGEEVSSTGDVLNGSQGVAEAGGSGAVESKDTSVPEQ